MKIVVSADHVRAGVVLSCVKCPIAMAVLDTVAAKIPTAQVRVYPRVLHIRSSPWRDWTTIQLPGAAISFIAAFDAGGIPAPFEFELPIGEHEPDPTNTPAAVAA